MFFIYYPFFTRNIIIPSGTLNIKACTQTHGPVLHPGTPPAGYTPSGIRNINAYAAHGPRQSIFYSVINTVISVFFIPRDPK